MKNIVVIFVFTILVTLFYRYVGQLVPQKEVPAPKEEVISEDLTTEQMVETGKKIVDTRGCMGCHAIQPRFPDLKGVGGKAGSRKSGMSDIEYFAEALYEPDAYIVESFSKGMTPANKPPLSLNDKEIKTVIAYLQSLGGKPTMTMKTELKYKTEGGGEAPPPPAGGAPQADMSGEQIAQKFACTACHSLDKPDRLVGPSLYDVGKRLNKQQLYESILDPDAVIVQGYPGGVMGATLQGSFYGQVTAGQLKKLVDYLSGLKGGK